MQIHSAPPTGTTATCDTRDDLLDCRMKMLGFDLYAIEGGDSKTLEVIKRDCMSCSFREACAVDLKHDPNNPVWEAYCPNVAALIGLAHAWWPPHNK